MLSQPLDNNTIERRWGKNLMAGVCAVVVLGFLILRHPPPPPDLFRELAIYDEIVPVSKAKFLEAANAFNAKKINSKQLIELIQKEFLPPWHQVSEHFDSLANIPSRRRELMHQIRTELKLREESWHLLVEALQKNDTLKFSASKDKWKQADMIVKQRDEPK